VLRLEFAAVKVMTPESTPSWPKLALKDGFPTEAKKVVDAGFAAGVLGTGANAAQHRQLRDRATKGAADDAKNIAAAKPRPPSRRPAPAWSTWAGPTRRWTSSTRASASSSRVSPRAA
jgi:hypothetical protein